MITVTVHGQTNSIKDLRGYAKILEREYLMLDKKHALAMKEIEELKDQLKPISDDTNFIKKIFTRVQPKEGKKETVTAKREREQNELMMKMITRGKKVKIPH